MKQLLKNIASVQTGIYALPGNQGDITYLQVKHFNEEGELVYALNPNLVKGANLEKHLLKEGDILFAAKGFRNFAVDYKATFGEAVASSSFFVIRVHEKAVLPKFLVWSINQPQNMKFLKDNAIGSSIQSISKEVLNSFEISVPPLETQKAILRVDELRKKEKEIKQQIEDLKNNYIQQLLIKATETNGR